MEELNNRVDELINYIKDSNEYKKCLSLKEKMDENDYIKDLVERIKKLQKEYIKNNDSKIKVELDKLTDELNNIPLYYVYNQNLDKVNEMILFVKDSLNNYFDELLNKKKN
jgi:cell fate (sporulation/competence/biofilm development) regulator YmcA (YheA/YmcA/DUF963 family)